MLAQPAGIMEQQVNEESRIVHENTRNFTRLQDIGDQPYLWHNGPKSVV
jgi:hypothetical protein